MKGYMLRKQRGFSIIESLASISFLGIVLVAAASSMSMSFLTSKRTVRESLALSLTRSKLEELSSVSPVTLSSANNSTESLTQQGVSFTRTTTIVVNADGSRTITVSVSGTGGKGGNVALTSTFSQWGNT